MAVLNQAKIIKAIEKIIKISQEDFIWEFLKAYGTPQATIKRLRLGDAQRNVARISGDLGVNQKLYFRPVKVGTSLFDAIQEIKKLSVLETNKIRFILVTDFQTVMAYDRKVDDSTEFPFEEFPVNYEFFLPMTGLYEKAIVYAEHPADTKACEKMGRLYDSIRTINHYEKDELHTLNVFLTRLLFCFFAEDTGIFPIEHQMTTALQSNTQADGSDVADFFAQLFTVLDLPKDSEERRQFPASIQAFPYVNGGLFKEKARIPNFNAKTRRLLIDCASMQWDDISPVIFGSMFQSVMDPEARRSLGAHYTSEKNILKLVRPLFLDDLEEELQQILSLSKGKLNALKEFQKKLGSLRFLDPACGCGNFLIVAYRELRELELRTLIAMKEIAPQESLWINVSMACKVTIDQFYGIELEEFPAEVARVSMLLMEHVMNMKVGKQFGAVWASIPLKHSATIVCANALTTPWEHVIDKDKLHYILGNPPFGGASMLTKDQKKWIVTLFNNKRLSSSLDFVTGWYKCASKFIKGTSIEVGFVSTNSICQGEQVGPLWEDLIDEGCIINFAHQSFRWNNESKNSAAVFCIIIGFSNISRKNKKIFLYDDVNGMPKEKTVTTINPYLIEGPTIIIKSRSIPLNAPLKMLYGNKPSDGGNFILNSEEAKQIICQFPSSKHLIRRYIGAADFLNNNDERYCIWLKGKKIEDWKHISPINDRVNNVRDFRLSSSAKPTIEKASTPHLFFFISHSDSSYLLIPSSTSERREYIPIKFMSQEIISSNANLIVPNATLYHFAILTSAMHMAWTKIVCGRLKTDYRYSASIVYNTFPWPNISDKQKERIEELAENVLMVREMYPEKTLAEMYDPDKMPVELREAHTALDIAVDSLYRAKPFENDEERLSLLFKLYEALIGRKAETTRSKR